jgi:hypothetical protein
MAVWMGRRCHLERSADRFRFTASPQAAEPVRAGPAVQPHPYFQGIELARIIGFSEVEH